MIDRTATARVQRLIRWLEPFQRCFGHRAQRLALRTYVHGVFSDSDRKSMQAMLARVTEPITYQGFQHFITHAVWDADRIWRRLLEVLPERRGRVDHRRDQFSQTGHAFGRRGASGTCGALGKIANCQVAVTAALWTGARAWLTGALLYLPKPWLSDADRRAVAQIPTGAAFQEKWRQALTLIRRARAAGLQITAVLADAEFGDVTAFRRALHRWRLPYAVGVSRHLTVFPGTPAVHVPPSGRDGPAAIAAGARPRHASDRRARVGVGVAGARLATGDLAQRDESPVGGPLRGRPRDPRPRLARSTAGARGLAVVRTGSRRDAAHQILLRRSARHAPR